MTPEDLQDMLGMDREEVTNTKIDVLEFVMNEGPVTAGEIGEKFDYSATSAYAVAALEVKGHIESDSSPSQLTRDTEFWVPNPEQTSLDDL